MKSNPPQIFIVLSEILLARYLPPITARPVQQACPYNKYRVHTNSERKQYTNEAPRKTGKALDCDANATVVI